MRRTKAELEALIQDLEKHIIAQQSALDRIWESQAADVSKPLNSSKTQNAAEPLLSGIDATLAERGARYGKFHDHARCAQAIQCAMEQFRIYSNAPVDICPWERLPPVMQRALTTIADKIARILNGDPMYEDNWHDIQGYSKLVEDWIKEQNTPTN